MPNRSRPGNACPPVALFIFNRPETTARVFERIAQAKPSQLLVVADGARADRPGEAERCAAARALVSHVTWDCEVRTNFSDENLGCRQRVSTGLDWVFDVVESAIVLEDDCLPDPTFFPFCAEMLDRHRDDTRIGVISGNNFQRDTNRSPYSYYFSRYVHIWGWASWRRTWRQYDVAMKLWPEVRDTDLLLDVAGSRRSAEGWRARFDAVHNGSLDTWDYQLTFTCWMQHMLCIIPNVNLVSNVGFGPTATHTLDDGPLANVPVRPMSFPLRHPPYVIRDLVADRHTQHSIFDPPTLLQRVRRRASTLFTR